MSDYNLKNFKDENNIDKITDNICNNLNSLKESNSLKSHKKNKYSEIYPNQENEDFYNNTKRENLSEFRIEKIEQLNSNLSNSYYSKHRHYLTFSNNDPLTKLRGNDILELESFKGFSNNNQNNTNSNINNVKDNNIYESSITNELRISNLERRLENTEKILKFYDEMMRLKDEEKLNEIRIDKNKIAELTKKNNLLEENIKYVNKKISEQNDFFNEKLEFIEKKFSKFLDNKNSIGDYYASKLAEFENLYKTNEVFYETKIEEKVFSAQNNFDGKIEDVLNLINDLTQQIDKIDFNQIESRENIRNIQNEHVDFLKIVSILKEKANTLDYVMDQITDLKQRYNKLVNLYGEQPIEEDDKFFNKMLNENNEN